VNVRKFVVRATHLDDLASLGTLTPQAARFLDACVVAGLNILVSGGTQAGKTTLVSRAGRHRWSDKRCHRLGRVGPFALPKCVATSSLRNLSVPSVPQRRICTAQSARECPCLVSRNRTERQIGIGVGSFPPPWLIKSGTLSPAKREPSICCVMGD
jgi:hypothetical protein